jgi:cytochrome c-type biogenesis protein CcmH/NrfG
MIRMLLALCVSVLIWPATGVAAERGEVYRFTKASTALILAIDDLNHSISLGSGFFVDDHGLLLTNAHVIEDSQRLVVYIHDQIVSGAPEVVAVDPDLDLAALRVRQPMPDTLPLAMDTPSEGIDVIAVGYPRITDILQMGFALHATIVPGTTSGMAYGQSRTKGRLTSFIQTTGLLNFGNSGGPLVRTDTGEVIGMVTTTVPYMERAKDRSGAVIGTVMMKAGISYSIPAPAIRDWLVSRHLMPSQQPMQVPKTARRVQGIDQGDYSFATAHLLHTMALVLREDEDLLKLAVRHYLTALAHRPDATRIRWNLGRAYTTLQDWNHALETYGQALERNPEDPVLMTDAGLAFQRAGRKEQAMALYRSAIRLSPRDSLAHNNLGSVLWEQGSLDEAISEYRLALSSDPTSALAAYNLGLALEAKGLPGEAVASWDAFVGGAASRSPSDVWLAKLRDASSRLKSSHTPAAVPAKAASKPVIEK